jgi:hypothetical protein
MFTQRSTGDESMIVKSLRARRELPRRHSGCAMSDGEAGYKAIRHLRQDNAKYTGTLVEPGLAPPEERLRNRIR